MTNENAKALMNILDAYKQNPTTENELKEALLISIATSLAQIADVMIYKAESEDKE